MIVQVSSRWEVECFLIYDRSKVCAWESEWVCSDLGKVYIYIYKQKEYSHDVMIERDILYLRVHTKKKTHINTCQNKYFYILMNNDIKGYTKICLIYKCIG